MNETTYVEREKQDVAEFLETLKKVPEEKKGEILGILKGYALCAETEQKGA